MFLNDSEPAASARIVPGRRADVALRMLHSGRDWHESHLELCDGGGGEGWLRARAEIERLARYGRETDIPFLIVNYPELRQLRPYPFESVDTLRDSMAGHEGIESVGLLPAVSDDGSGRLWVTAPDAHPNARADGLFARAIHARIRALLDPK